MRGAYDGFAGGVGVGGCCVSVAGCFAAGCASCGGTVVV